MASPADCSVGRAGGPNLDGAFELADEWTSCRQRDVIGALATLSLRRAIVTDGDSLRELVVVGAWWCGPRPLDRWMLSADRQEPGAKIGNGPLRRRTVSLPLIPSRMCQVDSSLRLSI